MVTTKVEIENSIDSIVRSLLSFHIYGSVHLVLSSIRKQASNGWSHVLACAFLPFLTECPIEWTRPNDSFWLWNNWLWTGFAFDDTGLPLRPILKPVWPYYFAKLSFHVEENSTRKSCLKILKLFWWHFGITFTSLSMCYVLMYFSLIFNKFLHTKS